MISRKLTLDRGSDDSPLDFGSAAKPDRRAFRL
jgi:hypothetical protein